jgi:transposase-like protein
LAKEKPPVFGMIQRTGEVVIRMLADVKQKTIGPLVKKVIAPGSVVYTDEYDIYHRLPKGGLHPPDGVSCSGGIRPGRRRGWVLRSARQHDGGVLVAAAELATAASWGLAGEAATVPGFLRVRA